MRNLSLLFTTIFLLFAGSALASGIIRGVVTDANTGETVPFANIFVTELSTGTVTDLDGNFNLELPEGTYSITFSYIGYAEYKVEEVNAKEGEVNVMNIQLKEEGTTLAEIVVTAKQIKNTDAAIATLKRKSTKLLDGVSSQTISKIGDSNAADAIKRVSGVSTEGGKYIYVRGLGDRYTKTLLNGMAIPGLDPDKNTVQMDIFPTNIIDNIVVFKTFSPDLPADFTGGIVDISTKDFPDESNTNISVSAGYNPNMNFINNFRSYEGGATDWMGFDDGTRALPFSTQQNIPDVSTDNQLINTLTSSFGKEMAAKEYNNTINTAASISHGNQINFGDNSIGYIAAVNYRNDYSHYEEAEFGSYLLDPNTQGINLENNQRGAFSTHNVLFSGLAGLAFKTKKHKISASYLLIQNGEDKVASLEVNDFDENPSKILRDILEYSQRTIHNIKASGKHSFGEGKFTANWSFSPTFIKVDEPDIRSTGFELTSDGEYKLQPSIGAEVTRTFRNLQETSYNGKVDLEYKFAQWSGLESKLKLGANVLRKERDFSIQNYVFRALSQSSLNLEGNPDNIFIDENLWTPGSSQGVYIKGNYEPANTFNATQSIIAGYAMTELAITDALKAVLGARIEKADNHYTGISNDGSDIYNNEQVLDEIDILPSANFIYNLTERSNLRVSYNHTLARPSFKEKSIAQIQDRISGRTFIGNLDLIETKIKNADIRWESFFKGSEMVSLSVFYKDLVNPIEMESYNELSPDNFTPRNQDRATVFGAEIEMKKNLDFIAEGLSNLSVGMNASYVSSRIKREVNIESYDSEYRQMVGQSPYLVNANIGYKNFEKGFEINVGYNVQGPKLAIVGLGLNPDVYEMPFHSLDAKASYRLGATNNWKVSISAGNLMNSERVFEYDGGTKNDGTYIWSLYKPGINFSAGLSYSFR